MSADAICMTCCKRTPAPVSLFANLVGWLTVCAACALAAEARR